MELGRVDSRAELAKLPVLRKPELMAFQAGDPPFGGFVNPRALKHGRVFLSPGPVWEPQGLGPDPWGCVARSTPPAFVPETSSTTAFPIT